MATKHHQQSRQREEHEPQREPQQETTAPAPIDDDFSTIRNRHEDLQPTPPLVLTGEVPDLGDAPGVDSVSVAANKPEENPTPTPRTTEGIVFDGANEPGEMPPSVQGTSQDQGIQPL
jgi:hypothetical protein